MHTARDVPGEGGVQTETLGHAKLIWISCIATQMLAKSERAASRRSLPSPERLSILQESVAIVIDSKGWARYCLLAAAEENQYRGNYQHSASAALDQAPDHGSGMGGTGT